MEKFDENFKSYNQNVLKLNELNKQENKSKRENLTLNIPIKNDVFANQQSSKPITFIKNFFENYKEIDLNETDELINEDGNYDKISTKNLFVESFQNANSSNSNYNDLENDVLNTPSIDIENFETNRREFLNVNIDNDWENNKNMFQVKNKDSDELSLKSDKNLKKNKLSKSCDTELCNKPITRNGKKILPKQDEDFSFPQYKVFLKMPDGTSLPISVLEPSTVNSQINNEKNKKFKNWEANYMPELLILNKNQEKQLKPKKIETTTLKSIKTALAESTSQISKKNDEINKPECSNSSYSSVASTSSSTVSSTSKDFCGSFNVLSIDTQPVFKAKPGRRSKNEPKEDPNEKKIRSLERNREAAMRCRTKRKVWVNALEKKAEELEKHNKELKISYDSLKKEINLFKSALLNDKNCPENSEKQSDNSNNNKSNLFDLLLTAIKKKNHLN